MNGLICSLGFRVMLSLVTICLVLSSAGVAAGQENVDMRTTAPAADADLNKPTSEIKAQPDDEVNPERVDKELLSELVIKYTNEERRKAGLEPLTQDDSLEALATTHSVHMARRDYFSHTTERPQGEDIPFSERVSAQELGFRRTAENLALEPVVLSRRVTTTTTPSGETTRDVEREIATYEKVARSTVEGWMKSPGHRKNILTPELNRVGIGIAQGERDGVPYLWITQNFGQK